MAACPLDQLLAAKKLRGISTRHIVRYKLRAGARSISKLSVTRGAWVVGGIRWQDDMLGKPVQGQAFRDAWGIENPPNFIWTSTDAVINPYG